MQNQPQHNYKKQLTTNTMLIDKYNRLLIDKLPANIASEVQQIKKDTDNFSDEELIEIYKNNFNDLFEIIQTKYPEALKPKKKLIVKTKVKLVKKAETKRTLVKKKTEPEQGRGWAGYEKGERLSAADILDLKKGDIILAHSDVTNGIQIKNALIVTKAATAKHPKIEVNYLEVPKEKENFVFWNHDLSAGNFFRTKEKGKSDNCEEAIEELSEIKEKREASAQARANAPKKKVSTAAREKQVKAATSVFKTKAFKGNRKHAEGFAKDLVAVYKKHGLTSIADQLQNDIDELIEKHYKA